MEAAATSARNRRRLIITFVASCGGFLFGYDLSLIGAANVFLRDAKLVATTTTFVWLAIFTSSQLFPMIGHWSQQKIGSEAGAFWLFTVVCLLSFWFGWSLLPETKGRTFEEIGRWSEKPRS